jgi:hypothetical protein
MIFAEMEISLLRTVQNLGNCNHKVSYK